MVAEEGLPPLPPLRRPPEREGGEEGEQEQEELPGKKQKGSGDWQCSPHQKEFMLGLRGRVDRGNAQTFQDIPGIATTGYIATPPHPYLGKQRGLLPDKDKFQVKPVGLWLPHLIFGSQPPCPKCCKNDMVTVSGWAARPRYVMGLHHHWYLDTQQWKRKSF